MNQSGEQTFMSSRIHDPILKNNCDNGANINRSDQVIKEISWYRICRNLIRFSTLIYLGIGIFILLVGILKLLWATTAVTSIDGGCIMIASFIMICISLLGYLGCLEENFCLIFSYGCLQMTIFMLRFTAAVVRLKISFFTKDSGHVNEVISDKSLFTIQDLISSLPGDNMIALELLYATIDALLTTASLYVSICIHRANSEREEDLEEERRIIFQNLKQNQQKQNDLQSVSKDQVNHVPNPIHGPMNLNMDEERSNYVRMSPKIQSNLYGDVSKALVLASNDMPHHPVTYQQLEYDDEWPNSGHDRHQHHVINNPNIDEPRIYANYHHQPELYAIRFYSDPIGDMYYGRRNFV